jgi:hypothetical protein
MRNVLPKRFAELTIQDYKNGQPCNTPQKKMVLLLGNDTSIHFDGITEQGDTVMYWSSYHKQIPIFQNETLVEDIKFIDSNCDEYHRFCYQVRQHELANELDLFAKQINDKFDQIVENDIVPETKDELIERLFQLIQLSK